MIVKFERDEEITDEKLLAGGGRLQEFHTAMWEALVPRHGACVSVQGELVRSVSRLTSELLRNGFGNYYHAMEGASLADNHYGEMVLFVVDTMIANVGGALDADDVAYFVDVRARLEPDWRDGLRLGELESIEEELTPEQQAEYDRLLARSFPWEELFRRAERCIANWCLVNHALVDKAGDPVEEGGVRDVIHVFEPPPPPPKCALCNGKGWILPKSASDFPQMCSCRKV